MILVLAAAFIVRMAGFLLGPALTLMLDHRMEFRGPDSGYLELKECLYLFERGYPLFNGGECHHVRVSL